MRRIALLLIALALLGACAGTEATSTPSATSAAPQPTTVPTQPATPTPAPLSSATATPIPTETPPAATAASPTATPSEAGAGPAIIAIRDGDLWLKPLPEGEEIQLTDLGDVVDFPEFSPDGRLILFHREGPGVTVSSAVPDKVPTSTWWAVPVTGGAPRMLLDPLAVLPQVPGPGGLESDLFPSEPGAFDWLPGGRELLFTTRYLTINGLPGNYDLWRLDVESGQLDELLPAGQGGRPVVSPDGEWLLLNTPTEIILARVDGSERQTLFSFARVPTYSEWEWVPQPVWNDDGSVYVAVARPWNVGAPVTYELWRLDPVSGDTLWLGLADAPWLHTPLWSPDRSRLAYAAADGGLMLAGAAGEEPRLAVPGGEVVPLAWSPDGRWVAFVQGGEHCVVKDSDGAAPMCVAPVFYGDAGWLDDDTLVVVANAGEDQPQFVALELPGGETIEVWTIPFPLFYDLYLGRR